MIDLPQILRDLAEKMYYNVLQHIDVQCLWETLLWQEL